MCGDVLTSCLSLALYSLSSSHRCLAAEFVFRFNQQHTISSRCFQKCLTFKQIYGALLEKEMATRSSVLAWGIPETEGPGRRPSMGSHRVGHDWSDLAAAAAAAWCSLDGAETAILSPESGLQIRVLAGLNLDWFSRVVIAWTYPGSLSAFWTCPRCFPRRHRPSADCRTGKHMV